MAQGAALGGLYPAEGERVGTVAFFTGCVMSSMLGFGEPGFGPACSTAAGYDVVVPTEQVCCGALANHAGLREAAVEAGRKNIDVFSRIRRSKP